MFPEGASSPVTPYCIYLYLLHKLNNGPQIKITVMFLLKKSIFKMTHQPHLLRFMHRSDAFTMSGGWTRQKGYMVHWAIISELKGLFLSALWCPL